MPLRQMVCSPRKLHTVTSNLLSCNEGVPSLGALHDAWRIRVFDATRARAYAVDLGNFPGRWFSGPSSSLTVTRSDVHAGRPNAFRHHPKKLVDIKPLTTEFHQDVSIYGVDDSVLLKLCDSEILMTAQAEGAAIELHGQGEQECQLTGMTTLQYDLSSLRSQTLRSSPFCHLCATALKTYTAEQLLTAGYLYSIHLTIPQDITKMGMRLLTCSVYGVTPLSLNGSLA